MKKEKNIYLVLDNIRSRENVGSIFRTADAVGVSKIYLCGITPTPRVGNPNFQFSNPKQIQDSDKIHKAALGAETYVPWEYYKETWRLIDKLKADKTCVMALEQTRKSENFFEFKPEFPLALIVGNEIKGISPSILKRADKTIAIPMYGRKESLNVAVAIGIALYSLIAAHSR